MKIVNKEEFLELPYGVLYSKYKLCYFGGLYVRLDVIKNIDGEPIDFRYKDLIAPLDANDSEEYFELLFEAEKGTKDLELDFDCGSRDGCYDNEQMFAVYSREDIINLSNTIAGCAKIYKPTNDDACAEGYRIANNCDYNRRHVLKDTYCDNYYSGWMDCFDWISGYKS